MSGVSIPDDGLPSGGAALPDTANQGALALTADTALVDATHKPWLKATPDASGWDIDLAGLTRRYQYLKNASASYTLNVYDGATFIVTLTDGMGWVLLIKDTDTDDWGF